MKKTIWTILILLLLQSLYANDSDRLNFAKRLYNDKLYTESLNELNSIIFESKNQSVVNESHFLIAEIYQTTNQDDRAESIYLQLLNEEANSSPYIREKSLEKLGNIYRNQNNWEKAQEYFKKLMTLYANTQTAKDNIIKYLESYLELRQYNDLIIVSRDLLKLYPTGNIQADIKLEMAKAYYEMKIISEAELLINQIKNEFPDSRALPKSLELQIRIIKKNAGTLNAINEIKKHLKMQINRNTEEILNKLLLDYQIEINNIADAEQTAELLLSKFNLSNDLDYYYLQWIKLNALLKTPYRVINDAENIASIMNVSTHKKWATFYLAENYFYANDLHQANSLINELESTSTENELLYEIIYLKARIFEKQANYYMQLNTLNHLTQYYSSLGNNAKLLYEIAETYQKHYEDPAQAILFYSQALTLNHDIDIKNKIITKIANCYEIMQNYQKALEYYNMINLMQLNQDEKLQLSHKINLLQLFYIKNNELLLEELLLQQSGLKNPDPVKAASLFGWALKDYDKAISLLHDMNDNKAQNELIKILSIMTYKATLDNDTKKYNNLIDTINKLTENSDIDQSTKIASSIIISWLNNKGTVNANLVNEIEYYLQISSGPQEFSFDNWFKLWLANYYQTNKENDKFKHIAKSIKKDIFINEQEYNKLHLNLAEIYYHEQDYQNALEHYKYAENWLNLANPSYYYHYTMSSYHTGLIENSLKTLKHLILNINDIPEINDARYLIADYSIENKDYKNGIEIILSIESNQRKDKDYIYLSKLYKLTNDSLKEKEALMHIQEKDIQMLRRLAILHEQTHDKIMSKYTWEELVKLEKTDEYKAYALFSLANIAYDEHEFVQASSYYSQAFSKIGKVNESEIIPFSIPQMAKRYIICHYKSNNRPRAENLEKEFKSIINNDPDALQEIKLEQGIYYINNDKKKAEKAFNDIIKNKDTPTYISDKAYLWRGILNLQLKKNTNAEQDFLMIANSEDIDIRNQAHLKLGTYYFSTENFEQAFEYYQSVMLNDSTGVYALDAASNYALLAKLTHEWEKAVQVYQMIIDRWGDQKINAETQFNIAFCYYQAKLYNKSIQVFEKYLNDFQTDELKAEALYWIGENQFSKEEYEIAVNAFLKVPYSYPNVIKWAAVAELRAGEAYLSNNQTDRAISQFKKVISSYGAGSEAGSDAKKRLNQLGVK